jgi:protein-S-isoprenylcysteine O-methyltransferase Ste14
MPIPGYIILSCWAIFAIYWLVSSLRVKPTAERKSYGSSLPYRILMITGAITIGKFHVPLPWNYPLTPCNDATGVMASAVCIFGLFISLWSRWTLAGNWSSDVRFKEGHQLIKSGLYRFVRHPIYTGILLMCSAPALQFGRLHCWLGLVLIAAGVWIKLKQEESLMLQHFPEYAEYRKQVKALVPYLI